MSMMRIVLALLIIVAGAVIALWQLDVVNLPLGGGAVSGRNAPPSLFAVVAAGDLERLEARLAAAEDVDARDEYGQTPLMYALANQAPREVVEALIGAGADVNARTDAGWTPLMYAARDTQDPQTFLLLLNAGADPTARNAEGETALTHARRNGKIAVTRLLPRLEELTDAPFDPAWPSGFTVPVEGATISSRASHLPGARRAYRNGYHEGFDFYNGTVSVPITYGTPITAVADGTVIRADHDYVEMTATEYDEIIAVAQQSLSTPPAILDKLRGRQVWIEHPGGYVSRYAHLSAVEPTLQVGARVTQGSPIGATGNSGTLEAVQQTEDDPHPHVEIWRGEETFLGQGLEPEQIYRLTAQLFGSAALPPYTE